MNIIKAISIDPPTAAPTITPRLTLIRSIQ